MTTTPRRYFVETFGCQMNVNDSEKVAGLFEAEGWERAPSAERADVVFINTCAVREKAAEKLDHRLARLKHLKHRHPELIVGVGGCVAQLQGREIVERSPHVDVLVGTHNVGRVPELVRLARGAGTPQVDLDRRADSFAVPDEAVAHTSPVRAYVTVMEGCNHVCSFCVVPRTRGPEVNRPADDVVREVRALARRGYPEVMLLGQTVNAYRHGDTGFADLLRRVHDVEGLRRLRFTTSHPEHVDGAMADAFRDLPRLCPYLHLPVQSGSDAILADMRRGYTRAEYLDRVALLRDRVPGLALSSDFIVGYPGETDDDFAASVSLVDEVGFDALFVFAYSPRPGTLAVRRADDVSEPEKLRRLKVLNEMQQRRQAARHAARVGTCEDVLIDTVDPRKGRVAGRTPDFKIVHLDGEEDLLGRTIRTEITGSGPNALLGRRAVEPPTLAAVSAAAVS